MALHPFFIFLILVPSVHYDVFLSFRGENTRKASTDHLYKALTQAGIRTFRDDDGIPSVANIDLAIRKAIHGSKTAVAVFSKGYASSRWCLDELVWIVESRRTAGLILLLVFYKVDPSEVWEQTGGYGEAFAKHQEGFKDDMDRVEQWRTALKEAADTAGMELGERYESEFIQDIVEEIKKMLNNKVQDVTPSLRGNISLVTYKSFFTATFLLLGFLLEVNASVMLSTWKNFFNSLFNFLFTVRNRIIRDKVDVRDPESTRHMVNASSTFDVFLSFRGATRATFICQLYTALEQEGIRVFRDEDEILRAENNDFEMIEAIGQSKMAIVVFCEKFCSSTWYLNELVLLMERMTAGLIVLPIFYKVDPSEVRKQTGRYGEAFARYTRRFQDEVYRVLQWRAALKKAAGLTGMLLGERHDAALIQSIVKEVKNKLNK